MYILPSLLASSFIRLDLDSHSAIVQIPLYMDAISSVVNRACKVIVSP